MEPDLAPVASSDALDAAKRVTMCTSAHILFERTYEPVKSAMHDG